MKILQICHRIPFPPVDGGNIAMMNMALALIEAGHEVYQFALNTNKHFVDEATIPTALKNKLNLRSVKIDTAIKPADAFFNLFKNDSYNVSRFFSKDVESELLKILRENNFDIVQLETLFAAPYIPCIKNNSTARIVLRAHNVEHIIWQRLAQSEKNIFRKTYLSFLSRRLMKFEKKTLLEIDALIPISTTDESIFRGFDFIKPVITIPLSIDPDEYPFNENEETEMCLFHLGSMDWMPNLEAVDWFLKKCWSQIHAIFPDLKLYLAGRNLPEEIFNAHHPNVICEGKIDDALSYMKKKRIMIVPLHSGSGIRVKIIQGMALGKTIISTTIGAEGIPAEDGKNIFIANTPDEFIATISKCIPDNTICRSVGINARKFVMDHYSNAAAGKKLTTFYNSLTNI